MSEIIVNELVYSDPKTGLMWAKNGNIAGEGMTWENAMNWVKSLNYGGYNDWRLPAKEDFEAFLVADIVELVSWIKINGFSNIQEGFYWSSSAYESRTDTAWIKGLAEEMGAGSKNNNFYVWPVRSEQRSTSLSQKFCIAFLSAFYLNQQRIVWTKDRVVRTNVMRSYIYQSIADFMGYLLICECPSDAAFYSYDQIKHISDIKAYPTNPEILLEHEIRPETCQKEINDLCNAKGLDHWKSNLKVLITYKDGTLINQQQWLNYMMPPDFASVNKNEFVFVLSNTEYQKKEINTYGTPTSKLLEQVGNTNPKLLQNQYWSFYHYNFNLGKIEPLEIDFNTVFR